VVKKKINAIVSFEQTERAIDINSASFEDGGQQLNRGVVCIFVFQETLCTP